MAIQRLRMLEQKSTAIAKQQRRAMAELLAAGKLESARIRVENIIRSDIGTELHEILELYCELLLARISLLEGPVVAPTATAGGTVGDYTLDSGLDEAVRSILYAAPRTDIKELQTARALLVEKFGKEYALMAAEGTGVPERVVKRVRVETPKMELVDAYLREIGKTYGVRFPGDVDPEDEDEDDDDEGGGGIAESVENEDIPALEAPLVANQDLARATPPRELGDTRAPVHIAPPSPTTENPKPTVKLPEGTKPKAVRKASAGAAASASSTAKPASAPVPSTGGKAKEKPGGGPGGKIPDVDELAKRFAALKRG
jgi:vacuolar protein sorting-associated protein IST1